MYLNKRVSNDISGLQASQYKDIMVLCEYISLKL